MLKQKRFWFGLTLSLVLLASVFYQTDPAKIWDSLRQAQYVYLIPALMLYFIGVGVRALRWHFLLRSIKPIPTRALFRTVVIGYMANDILPARMGELVRAYLLGQQQNVSKAATLVTIVVERVFDGLTMLTFIVAASSWLNFGDAALAARLRLVGALFIAAIAALAILAGMPHRVERLADLFVHRLPSASLRTRAARLTRSLLDGLGALRSPADSFAVYALSLSAWLCETGMYALIALGFGIALPFPVFLLAAAFANLVTIAPSTPGYVGVFDAPMVYTLALFGVNQNLATSYTIVLHAALYLPVTLLGFYYAWRAGLSLTQLRATSVTTVAANRDGKSKFAGESGMDLIYLDYNCFQRGFDDPRQVRIQMEALACQEIFERAERGQVRLVWSFMHEDETILCPFPERKYEVLRLAVLCKVRVGPQEDIRSLAQSFQKQGRLSAKDAIHLACASYVGADILLTCDDSLIRRVRQLNLEMTVMNPVDYVRREAD